MELSPQEAWLISELRRANPFERLEITKDREGKPNRFLLHKSQKYMATEIRIEAIN